MRKRNLYGCDTDLPLREGFKYRAKDNALSYEMTLCDYCLRGNRRCHDAKRNRRNHQKNWKRHRRTRWT